MQDKIIVLEDDQACRELLAFYLESKGYEVAAYPSASFCLLSSDADGICRQDDRCAQFILTDNQMPGVKGLDMIARQKRAGCKVPVGSKALLSGSLTPADLTRARELGCAIYSKPYSLSEIVGWLVRQQRSDTASAEDPGSLPPVQGFFLAG